MPEHLGRKLAISLVSFALALTAAELWTAHWFPVRALNLELDDELLYVTVPSSRKMLTLPWEAGGGRVLVRMNGRGFRGRELRQPKDRERIAVFGDSLVMAENVALEDTFVERLGRHLERSTGRSFEMVNAGVSGYGPDQELARMERELPALEADVALVVVCAHNDFGDLVRNKRFLLDEDDQLVETPFTVGAPLAAKFAFLRQRADEPALVRATRYLFESLKERPEPRQTTSFPYMHMYLYGIDGVGGLRAEYEAHVVRREPEVDSALQDYYDADVAIFPDWDSSRFKRRLMRAVLARMRAVCEAHGVRLAGVVVPSAVDVYPGFQIRVDPVAWGTYEPRRLGEEATTALTEAGIPAVSLFELFSGPDSAELFASYRDVHWSALGQDRAADQVASFLVEKRLVED